MISDQAARERALDISKSFLVQAPAGSGKTSLLVQRFLSALAVAKHGPEEIIAITFTRKAAAEMRDRILAALELGASDIDPSDPYMQKIKLLAQKVLQRDQHLNWNLLQNPARLKIQTIDALCASITKQMPILSRFGSQPQIEPDATLLYNRAVDQLLQTLVQDTPWHDGLMFLLDYLDNDRVKVKRLLFRMLQIREQWLAILVRHCAMTDIRDQLEAGLALVVAETLEHLEATIPEILDFALLPSAAPQDLQDWLQIAAVLLTTENQWRRTVTAKEGFAPPSKAKDKVEKVLLQQRKDAMLAMLEDLTGYDAFKQQLIAIRHLPPQVYTDQQWAIVDALTIVLPVLAAQLTVVFKDHGKVDFVEVALAAINALQAEQAPSDLALALDYKIQHILVDEFQDTSHTQYRLLECLTANWDADDGRTLFLVGDPMQSIYRFRQAEVGLYLKAKQHGINNIKLNFVQLTVNFRSTANVLQWINRVFAQSFPGTDDMTLGAISYMPAQAADVMDPGCSVDPVQCFAVDSNSEALKIVELIKSHKQQDPNRSIAILVRAKSHLLNLLPALRQYNIEYQGIEIESLKERPIIQDLLALTRALLHLEDRIAWLAILRAPWCGLTLAELNLLTNSTDTIWHSLQNTLINDRAQRFKLVMADALAKLGRMSLAELVHNTWVALGGMQCLLQLEELQEAETYLQLLMSFGNQREIHNSEFLAQQLDRLFSPALNVNPQAVQVMTMHKAKGLEFDVVILPGLARSIKSEDPQLLLLDRRDYEHEYLLIAAIRAASERFDPLYDYLAWCEKQRQEYETLRLFYVAATRAKQQIYCLAALEDEPPLAASMLSKIWDAVAAEFVSVESHYAPETTNTTRKLKRLPEQWFVENPYVPQNLTATKVTLTPWQADWLRIAGIVMHRTLHNIASEGVHAWDLQRLSQHKNIWRQHLRQLGLAVNYHEQALQIIQQAIANTMQDPFGAKILSAQYPESYSEWRLTRQHEDDFEHMILDRVFVDHDATVWLIDYKLVQHGADLEAALRTYGHQLNKYRQILQTQKPGNRIIAGLYFPLQAVWCQTC